MNHLSLYAKCAEQINRYGNGACIVLVVPRLSSGLKIRLAGKNGGPLGIVLSESYSGGTTASFNCKAIIKWLEGFLLPHKCFMCDREECATTPWVLNVDGREAPIAVFTCKDCPHMTDYLKDKFDATVHSTAEAINAKTKHLYETK